MIELGEWDKLVELDKLGEWGKLCEWDDLDAGASQVNWLNQLNWLKGRAGTRQLYDWRLGGRWGADGARGFLNSM